MGISPHCRSHCPAAAWQLTTAWRNSPRAAVLCISAVLLSGRDVGWFVGWLSLGACWCTPCPAAPCSLTRHALADCSITKFLNRILGLEVDKQNMLFQYFSDTFDYLIEKDKKEGKYDMGILGMEKRGVARPLPTAPLRFSAPPCAD